MKTCKHCGKRVRVPSLTMKDVEKHLMRLHDWLVYQRLKRTYL